MGVGLVGVGLVGVGLRRSRSSGRRSSGRRSNGPEPSRPLRIRLCLLVAGAAAAASTVNRAQIFDRNQY